MQGMEGGLLNKGWRKLYLVGALVLTSMVHINGLGTIIRYFSSVRTL